MTRKEEIESRKNEIKEEIRTAESEEELDTLEQEVDALNEEVELIEEVEQVEEISEKVENNEVQDIEEVSVEEKNIGGIDMETRNSKKYIDAYAEYVKTGKDDEVRALLTENVSGGTIAVPDFILDEVKTAWDKNDILSLVRKTYIKGNLKVNFEISGTDAVIHTEGGEAVSEETLTEGIATITPASIKKWISISDEAMDMRGEAFLRYIYDELTYKIAKKAADTLVNIIKALPQTANSTTPRAAKVTLAPGVSTVAEAYAHLSDEATDVTITMNKLTYSAFKKAQYENGYAVDVFEGYRVRFNNQLKSYDAASAGEVYMIIGDYDNGAIANFPNGEEITLKFDELSRKKEDLVEVLGREYVGLGVVACDSFVLVAKPGEVSE